MSRLDTSPLDRGTAARPRWMKAAAFLLLPLALGSIPAAGEAPRIVEIVAKRFEFNPKEVTLKKGETVTLRFRSEDVTHGFLLKKLKLDVDIVPGKTVEATITPEAPGTYTAICDHFCGAGHGNMKMKVVVE